VVTNIQAYDKIGNAASISPHVQLFSIVSTPTPTSTPTPEPTPTPTPEPTPHIDEILVDPDDIDGEQIMNIEGIGTVEMGGSEFNAAMVTDDEGNTFYLVDVDGEVNDPNATYDIIVDAETGDMVGLPTNLSVSDATAMAESGVGYHPPVENDSYNVPDDQMAEDIYDLSQYDGGDAMPDTDILVDPIA
jgi:hypothetical protein